MCEISGWSFFFATNFMLFTKVSNKNADKQRPTMERTYKNCHKINVFPIYMYVVYLCWIIMFVLCAYIYHLHRIDEIYLPNIKSHFLKSNS